MEYRSTLVVTEDKLAINVGSGNLRVLATPAMMALMENAAMMAAKDIVPEGSTTVGGQISSSHIRPTGLGHTVHATATLTEQDGRKLSFKIVAEDEQGIIGEGTHIRFIVDRDRFMSKVTEV